MVERNQPSQKPPAAELDLQHFPSRAILAGTQWKRAHRAEREPWFFASAGSGRFDLEEPMGTCYVANRAEGAAREVIGPEFISTGFVNRQLLKDRVVSTVLMPSDLTAAKLTADGAFAFGVSNELSATSDYSICQSWAAALASHGFTAIWYQPRFSPAKGRAVAVFGDAGARTEKPHETTSLESVVERMPGVTIVDTGKKNSFDIRDEPM